jgi:DNA replication protein DnaC
MPYSHGGCVRWVGTPIPDLPDPWIIPPEFADAWRKVQRSLNAEIPLILGGRVGTGKTTFLAWIAQGLKLKHGRATSTRTMQPWLDDPVWWTSASEYVDDVHTGRSHSRRYANHWSDDYDAMGLARRARYLFFDDLGVEPSDTSGNHDIITRLIEDRCSAKKPTWVSTNLSSEDLLERYGQRFQSRLFSMSVPVAVGTHASQPRREVRRLES